MDNYEECKKKFEQLLKEDEEKKKWTTPRLQSMKDIREIIGVNIMTTSPGSPFDDIYEYPPPVHP